MIITTQRTPAITATAPPTMRSAHHFHRKNEKNDEEEDIDKTICWWRILSFIAVFNIAIWCYKCTAILSLGAGMDIADITGRMTTAPVVRSHQRQHLMLSGIYVLVCAYRSFLPRIDLERYCLFDTFYSSIFLGRTAATIAELSFAAQIALFVHDVGRAHHHKWMQVLALLLVPSIALAQTFCWCGVLTLNHFYHAVEESIWALMSGLLSIALLSFAWHVQILNQQHTNDNDMSDENKNHHYSLLYSYAMLGCVASGIFFLFMVTCDVPMYVRRWRESKNKMNGKENENENNHYTTEKEDTGMKYGHGHGHGHGHIIRMNPSDGGRDAWERRVVTKSWNVWREESVWLTCYFSTGVWLSLMLVHVSE